MQPVIGNLAAEISYLRVTFHSLKCYQIVDWVHPGFLVKNPIGLSKKKYLTLSETYDLTLTALL